MNLKFFIGKNYSRALNFLLKNNTLSLSNRFPFGIHHKNDIRKIFGDKNLIYFDVGANVGNTVIDYYSFFKNIEIYCFEPILATYQILDSRVSNIKQIHAYNFAFGDQETKITINRNSDNERNSLLNSVDVPNEDSEVVTVKRLDEFCKQNDIEYIDILKIDVEGFELQVLNGLGDLIISKVAAIYLEVGFVKNDLDKTNFTTVDTYLINKGFMLSGFYENFRWGENKKWLGFANALYIKK